MEDLALSVAWFEADIKGEYWQITVLCAEAPPEEEIARRLALLAELTGIDVPDYTLEAVQQQDWLAATARDFPPMQVGKFFVYGSHIEEKMPMGTHPIQVDAGQAFGSGEHATTQGCLQAIEARARYSAPARVLDLGCGSAILGMAAARCWRKAWVIASDIDKVAVRVATQNVKRNWLHTQVRLVESNGLQALALQRAAPYDVIIANILARPLQSLAPAIVAALSVRGYVILSGLLTTQEQAVLHRYRLQGLRLAKRVRIDGWSTLILEKPCTYRKN